MKIDIVTTATLRPSLLEMTYSSFKKRMIKDSGIKVILNVDPIGENIEQEELCKIAQKYFRNVFCFFPNKPGFSDAVIRCWKSITSNYVLHLEDDWILNVDVDLDNMIKIMTSNPQLVSLRLNKDKTFNPTLSKDFVYFEKLSLNPTLFRADFLRTIVKYMDPLLNPEKQLRTNAPGKRGEILRRVKHGIYVGSGNGSIIRDIGREWMNSSNYSKETGFTEWRSRGYEY